MGRAPCCDKANVKRGPWSPEEDAALKTYLETHGTGGNWMALPGKAGLFLSLSLSHLSGYSFMLLISIKCALVFCSSFLSFDSQEEIMKVSGFLCFNANLFYAF
jgi:hypothetical protein